MGRSKSLLVVIEDLKNEPEPEEQADDSVSLKPGSRTCDGANETKRAGMVREGKRCFSSQVHKRPEVVVKEHESFKKRVALSLKIGKRKASLASSEEELERQIEDIRAAAAPVSGAHAAEELDVAAKVHDVYKKDRREGGKQVTKNVQRGLNAFAQFLDSYRGISEAISTAGGPYAQVGFQTLSILLIVFVNKTNNDTRIIEHLDQMRKSLPRLDIWQQIYPNDAMRKLVATAYSQVIDFSRAAAEYFSRFWYRIYLAINPIASVTFEDIAAGLHLTLAEVNSQAMVGLHETSQEIHQRVQWLQDEAKQANADRKTLLLKNEEAAKVRQRLVEQNEQDERDRERLLRQNEELKRQVEEQIQEAERRERQDDMRMLSSLQKLLNVADSPLQYSDIAAVKRVLMEVFPNQSNYSPALSHTGYFQLNEPFFKEIAEYQGWVNNVQSSLFFLSGSTAIEGRKLKGFSHCWLSPAAIYIAEHLRRQGNKVAFFSCHPGLQCAHPSGDTVLSSLIFQVIQWQPQILRFKDAEFRQILQSTHHTTREHMLCNLLDAILTELQDLQTIYLVIDRLDCCETSLNIMATELARLLTSHQSPSFRVKVAIVAETSGGEGDWDVDFLPEHEYATDRLYVIQNWDQQRLNPWETSLVRRPSVWSSPTTVTV